MGFFAAKFTLWCWKLFFFPYQDSYFPLGKHWVLLVIPNGAWNDCGFFPRLFLSHVHHNQNQSAHFLDLDDFGEYYHGAGCLELWSRLLQGLPFYILLCCSNSVDTNMCLSKYDPAKVLLAPLDTWRNADEGPINTYRIICPLDLGKYPSCFVLQPKAPSFIIINPQCWILSRFTAPCACSWCPVPPLLSSSSLLEQPWVPSLFPWTNRQPSAGFCPL